MMLLFSQDDLTVRIMAEAMRGNGDCSSLIDICRFDWKDYSDAVLDGQTGEVHRANASSFENALDFWIEAQNCLSWNHDFMAKGRPDMLCEPCSNQDLLDDLHARSVDEGLKNQFDMPRGQFVAGMIMRKEWDGYACICQTTEEYFAFFWITLI